MPDFEMSFSSGTLHEQVISVAGSALTDWVKLALTIKANPDTDDDTQALLVVRATNPADPGDGVLIHNGSPATETESGGASLEVTATGPDGAVKVTLYPVGSDLPPTPSSAVYVAQIDYWKADGHRRRFATGNVTVSRSVRRATAQP